MPPTDEDDWASTYDLQPRRPRFQFLVRDLLVATTIASVCLAIGIHFFGFIAVVGTVCIAQVAVLLASDWLIRPENRRALAFATAGIWAVLGSGLLLLALPAIFAATSQSSSRASVTLAISLIIGAGISYFMAVYRWRTIAKK